jgi:hypothetical protein
MAQRRSRLADICLTLQDTVFTTLKIAPKQRAPVMEAASKTLYEVDNDSNNLGRYVLQVEQTRVLRNNVDDELRGNDNRESFEERTNQAGRSRSSSNRRNKGNNNDENSNNNNNNNNNNNKRSSSKNKSTQPPRAVNPQVPALGVILYQLYCVEKSREEDKLQKLLLRLNLVSDSEQEHTNTQNKVQSVSASLKKIVSETQRKTIVDACSDPNINLKLFNHFNNVFIVKSVKEKVENRNCTVNDQFLFRPLTLVAPPKSFRNNNACRTTVVTGSSGSGKTLITLALAAMRGANTISIYFRSKELVEWGLNKKKERSLISRNDDDLPKDFNERNLAVQRILMDTIESVVNDAAGFQVAAPEKDCTRDLVVIIDEVGDCPLFVKGLCRIAGAASAILHRRYLDAKFRGNYSPRVHFVVAGTGVADRPPGSESNDYDVLPVSENDSGLFNWLLKRPELEPLSPLSHLLDRFRSDRTLKVAEQQQPLSSTERAVANLVKNSRCAVLFLRALLSKLDSLSTAILRNESHPPRQRDSVLSTFVVGQTLDEFFDKNGLEMHIRRLDVLLAALGVAAHRVTNLDDINFSGYRFIAELLRGFERRDNLHALSASQLNLRKILTTDCGVLRSRMHEVSRDRKSEDSSTATTAKTIARRGAHNKSNNDTQDEIKTLDYFMSPPYVAMLKMMLGFSDRPLHWSEFEHRVADYCTMLAAASRVTGALIRNSKQQNPQLSKQHHLYPDLQLLRKWLVFDGEAAGVRSFNINELMVDRVETKLIDIRESVKNEVSPFLSKNLAVVLTSAERESFADVTVLGPDGTIILLQCKHLQSSSKIDFETEFSKMGVGTAKETTKTHINFLKNLYPKGKTTIIRAAVVCEYVNDNQQKKLENDFKDFIDQLGSGVKTPTMRAAQSTVTWNDFYFFNCKAPSVSATDEQLSTSPFYPLYNLAGTVPSKLTKTVMHDW